MIGLEPASGLEQRLLRELLYAMENARSRLAVAIAAENKVTPRERWRDYLETENQLRRCLRRIRRQRIPGTPGECGWFQALSLLKQPLPAPEGKSPGEAQILCHRLREVIEIIGIHTNEE